LRLVSDKVTGFDKKENRLEEREQIPCSANETVAIQQLPNQKAHQSSSYLIKKLTSPATTKPSSSPIQQFFNRIHYPVALYPCKSV
jgi:hypothetical protein